MVFSVKKLTKSICYDDYWRFAYLRHERFLASVKPQSVSADEILDKYKFTNCYRVLDRTSQFLVKKVICAGEFDAPDTFFRVLLFKLFNKIETWEKLESALGVINICSFDERAYGDILHHLKQDGNKIYSAAYIMPSGKREYGSVVKHENNLKMLKNLLSQGFQYEIWEQADLQSVYNMFLKVPSIGRFLAYQYAIDISYSKYSRASEDQFVVAGPGALRGIKKCFPTSRESDSSSIIHYMSEVQESEFSRLGYDFKYLHNRQLQLIDCQNLFCEVDKYLRVRRPDFDSGDARIKQKYKKHPASIEFFFPPKWNATLPKEFL
jgi:hypothetical protein